MCELAEEGDTKDDLQLPTYPDGFGQEIKNQFDEGKTLVRAEAYTVLSCMRRGFDTLDPYGWVDRFAFPEMS